jgi:hypothetical protein
LKRNDKSTQQPASADRGRRRAFNEARYDELLDRALRRREYEKRFGRGDY